MKQIILISLVLLTGCASQSYSGYSSSKYQSPTYIRNAQGSTVAKIQDGAIYTPDGTRVARIDSKGNIFTTTGVRIGRASK